jgi:hypothetical protein
MEDGFGNLQQFACPQKIYNLNKNAINVEQLLVFPILGEQFQLW